MAAGSVFRPDVDDEDTAPITADGNGGDDTVDDDDSCDEGETTGETGAYGSGRVRVGVCGERSARLNRLSGRPAPPPPPPPSLSPLMLRRVRVPFFSALRVRSELMRARGFWKWGVLLGLP